MGRTDGSTLPEKGVPAEAVEAVGRMYRIHISHSSSNCYADFQSYNWDDLFIYLGVLSGKKILTVSPV